ncbi:MAG: tRNA uridine-5-carboxymethylaminomethyl(34) synthesis enzyme MnmG [Sphingomonadaceae bacterium]|nr:tRNA uridine-5-carboxymethylaminomethyl(34) synthesis enzyme MnmG [Sphingomonadaceae bacterium]
MMPSFDVIVVGGGHAGCEAAAVAARMGASVALVTMRADMIGAMSCNPAIGGLGKGHLVREVDAFDGLIGRAADAAAIHYRMLNRSKGAAVQGPRVQADRRLFRAAVQSMLAELRGLSVIEGEAAAIEFDASGAVNGLVIRQKLPNSAHPESVEGWPGDIGNPPFDRLRVSGIGESGDGGQYTLRAKTTVLATGTFLGGKLHFGMESHAGGRVGEAAAAGLSAQLRGAGLPIARLKTGTPPRLDGRSIDWAGLERQASDGEGWTMSPLSGPRANPELFCAITRTNAQSHQIIRDSLDRSPLFSGVIEGKGPRYCPSIEDKIFRFSDRDGHQVFLEPEGLDDPLIYPNGISTSLPADVQLAMVRSMAGLERAEIVQPGYAVEYDYVDPRVMGDDLGVEAMPGLFLAGQINGTTGYEEAAAQGLVAGINAARRAAGEAPARFDRHTSYIGVMIDDLTLQGVTEPYRMLTARAEYRLRLRADNAATRLGETAEELGCLGPERRGYNAALAEMRGRAADLLGVRAPYAAAAAAGIVVGAAEGVRTLGEWLRLPGGTREAAIMLAPELAALSDEAVDEAIEDARYAPYLARQQGEITRMRADEGVVLGALDFSAIPGLSNEMVERLSGARPATLGAAGRIRGITPAALAAILAQARRRAA